jgi:hypothetical protein
MSNLLIRGICWWSFIRDSHLPIVGSKVQATASGFGNNRQHLGAHPACTTLRLDVILWSHLLTNNAAKVGASAGFWGYFRATFGTTDDELHQLLGPVDYRD